MTWGASTAPEPDALQKSREMTRILEIRREELEDRGADLAREWTARLRKHAAAPSLFPIQGVALEVAHRAKAPAGLLGNITVGGGKTLIFALIPQVANLSRPLLLLEPSLIEPAQREWWKWSRHYYFEPPKVLPYSELSSPGGTDVLTRMVPDAILSDECQALKRFTAARTKRFLRFMQSRPETRFFGLTGTLTTTTIKDYAHLAELALRNNCPMPLHEGLLDLWASVLSADGEPSGQAYYHLKPLLKWAGIGVPQQVTEREKKAAYQEAFSRRWVSAPGTVNTSEASCRAAIVLEAHRFAVADELTEVMDQVSQTWTTPDGEEFEDALTYHRILRQLSMGFYYVWDWPGQPDEEYLEARRGWARATRWWLEANAHEGLDSPALLDRSLRDSGYPEAIYAAWSKWQTQKHKPDPPTKAVWVDYTPILEAVTWAAQREAGIIWFYSDAVGQALQGFGIPTMWEGVPDPEKTPIVALAIAVYHRGYNLQAWNDQLVMEVPTNAAVWEQLIGRTHRSGQKADVINLTVFQHLWPLTTGMATAMKRAAYMQATSQQPQKLLNAELRGFSGAVTGAR